MAHPRFVEGNISTNMIGDEYPDGFSPEDLPHEDPAIIISVAASIVRRYRDRAAASKGSCAGTNAPCPMTGWW